MVIPTIVGTDPAKLDDLLNTIGGAANTDIAALAAIGTVTVADVAALPSASLAEGKIVHVDAMNCNFQAIDGVWVQISDASFSSISARNTEYAKAGAAYRVPGARAKDTSTGITWRNESGTTWYRAPGNRPVFSVFATSAQTLGSGAVTLTSAWGTPTVNDGFTSFTSGALTVTETGNYQISLQVRANVSTEVQLWVNGVQFVTTGSGNPQFPIGVMIPLTAADVLTARLFTSGSGAVTISSGSTYWSVAKMS